MSFNTIWDPSLVGTTTQRADDTATFFAGTVTGNFSAVLGGPMAPGTPGGTNLVQADQSTIVNGNNNSIFATAPPTGNEIYNLIGNGTGHRLVGFNSSIFNGDDNTINPTGGAPVINTQYATIANGNGNVVSGSFSFIGGGGGTPATGNTIEATYGFIGNGFSNHIYIGSDNSFIGGGATNEIATLASGFASAFSFIGGGESNTIRTNNANGRWNVIAGGSTNEICANSFGTTIGGGTNNHAQGATVTIGGGQQICAFGDFNTVAGGIGNNIRVGSQASFIGGGSSNAICGGSSTIAGGNGNGIMNSSGSSFIGGGFVNFIGSASFPANNPSNFSFIGGGGFNCIDTNSLTNSSHNSITGGCCNTILPNSQYSFIGTGECNTVQDLGNQVVGGNKNYVDGAYSIIGSGNMNVIDVTSAGALVGTNGIFVGNASCICGESTFSGIGAGGKNMVECGYASFIGGGDWNCIYPAGGGYRLYRSFIGGGFENCVESNNSVIAGGITNSILTSNADAAVIAGGANNTVNAPCGAVLGGAGNTVNHAYAAVFGNSINTVANGHFHVNNLWMAPATYNTYNGIAPALTFPQGTVYVDTSVGAGLPLRMQQ